MQRPKSMKVASIPLFSVAFTVFSFALTITAQSGSGSSGNNPPPFKHGTPNTNAPNVISSRSNGPTNPSHPSLGTPINQTSDARLLSINSFDDWCTFSSPNGELISDVEGETVAYCVQQRNNARLIPGGTVTAAHFVKTPLYV